MQEETVGKITPTEDAGKLILALYLRIVIGAFGTYRCLVMYGETFEFETGFLWFKYLLMNVAPYLIAAIHYKKNPERGLGTIVVFSLLESLYSLFEAIGAGLLGIVYSPSNFVGIPVSIYLYFKASASLYKYKSAIINGLTVATVLVIGTMYYFSPFLVSKLWFLNSSYVYSKGEMIDFIAANQWVPEFDISQDGNYVLSVNRPGIKKLNGKKEAWLNLHMRVNGAAFSPNGKHAVFGGAPDTKVKRSFGLSIIDTEKILAEKGKVVNVLPEQPPRPTDDNTVLGVAFSPDGKYIAVETEQSVELWEVTTGEVTSLLQRSRLHNQDGKNNRTHVVFSQDGRLLATSGSKSGMDTEGKILIWDVKNKKLLLSIDSGKAAINALRFSPSGTHLAAILDHFATYRGGHKSNITVWNMEGGKVQIQIQDNVSFSLGNNGAFTFMDYSADGRYIATSFQKQKVIGIWDAQNGKMVKVIQTHFGRDSYPAALKYTLDGRYLYVRAGSGDLERWQVTEL